jgi:hypothetical protein
MSKYQSITTSGVKHDPTNFLTEVYFLNKYGALPQYPWRKEQPLAKEWGKVVSIFRKILKVHKIQPEQIGWYLHSFKPCTIDAKSFGLMVWKIKRLFKTTSLDYLSEFYSNKFKHISDGYMSVKDQYAQPSVREKKDKDLLSILEELEKNGTQESD